MKPPPSFENDEQDQEIIKLLKDLGFSESKYPPELLAARRAAFLARIEQLRTGEAEDAFTPADQEIVRLLGSLKSASVDYPSDLLAARRAAFLQKVRSAGTISLLDRLRVFIKSLFQENTSIPTVLRTSLVVASLIGAALIGFLFSSRLEQSFRPSTSQVVEPALTLPTGTDHLATILCQPDDKTPPCPSLEREPGQDLADQGNGLARSAVSSEVGIHKAAYVNDGRTGTSWVSSRADSWIKIDLGKVTTINSVSLQKGNAGSSNDNHSGQFVIAVALSDVYSDGNNSNDYTEYAQVFNSAQTGFDGTVSHGETVRTLFPPVKARFVKITFESAGAAIDEVGVFMVPPAALAETPTRIPAEDVPEETATLIPTDIGLPADTATPVPTGTPLPTQTLTQLLTETRLPTETLTPLLTSTRPSTETSAPPPTDIELPTDTAAPILTDTPQPSVTPIPRRTSTRPAADTATPVSTNPLPFATPLPSSTAIPPTAIPPTAQPLPASPEPIIITGNAQTLAFTCNGNDVTVRGHANTVILFGSCNSITVTGNGNSIFWQSGSPVITDQGQNNIISQG